MPLLSHARHRWGRERRRPGGASESLAVACVVVLACHGASAPRNAAGQMDDDAVGITAVSMERNGTADPIGSGERVRVSLTFDAHVNVTGAPRFALAVGTRTRLALYSGRVTHSTTDGEQTTRMDFHYDVQTSDVDTDGLSFAANALRLEGGTIRGADGTDVSIDLGDFALATSDFAVNGGVDNAPVVTRIYGRGPGYPRPRDTFELGERIAINVVFSEYLELTGAPSLGLTIGTRTRPAAYVSRYDFISGTTRLRFTYDVEASDLDTDCRDSAAYALALNGGTLRNAAGTDANLDLGSHAVTDDPDRQVDGRVDTAPRLGLINFGAETFGRGERIRFSVWANEHLTVTGEPTLALIIGDHPLARGNQVRQMEMYQVSHQDYGSYLRLHYDVQAADVDANGLSITASALSLNGGTIRDAGGNDANLSLDRFSFTDTGRFIVDGTVEAAPETKYVGFASRSRVGDTYRRDETIRAFVRFDKPPTVIGSPVLALDVGGESRLAAYDGISADGLSLLFTYTVQASDLDADGIVIGSDALTLDGGAIRDAEGRDAGLSLEDADHSTWGLHKVDGGDQATGAAPE
ncbi:MAG: hypothetical protein F4Y14_03355 [Acidobacteria bacterium]|nr:hypothetical protein [Acidobacteriota bacterium]